MTTKASEKRNQPSCLIDRLPRDVLMGILSTLRVKSLLQLRCVCKSCYFLISNSQFVKTHLNLSIACPDLLKQRQHIFMMTNLSISECPYAFTLESALPDDNVGDIVPSVVKLDCIPEIKKYTFGSYTTVIGSCDGLLCLRFGSTAFYVFNLSTRESKRIPEPDFKFCYWEDFYILGFGYDQSVHDYKLVAGDKKRFYVYSLRTDSWKKVEGLPPKPLSVSVGILLNGVIHWLLPLKRRLKIVTFCFADEKFCEFPLPTFSFRCTSELGLLGGCLCILLGRGNEIWVMKEYGRDTVLDQSGD
ncbi:F-box/kelch-repeat protein At3g06240-like [Cornus florida]|uniref:F-box/kelch-repeat protein At3g06240-like n=1 Tax=Cornus florida TaxID=4283 RepID=UPI002897992D|nr:F-box/kelch-repeat protein At3g06240-like [Cornus florida]